MKQLAIVSMWFGLCLGAAACGGGGGKGGDSTGPDPMVAPDTLQLTWKAPPVGQTVTIVDNLDTKLHFMAGPGQELDMVATKSETTNEEVVEVAADGAVTKVKVRYETHLERQTMNGQSEDKPTLIAGKSYLVWAAGGVVQASHDDGSPVSPEELAEITDDQEDLGKVPGMATLLVSRPWKIAEAVELSVEELHKALGEQEEMQPVSGKMTLLAVAGGVGTFELVLVAAMEKGGHLDANMTMTLDLDIAHVRPNAMKITGSFQGQIQGMATTGLIEGAKSYTYR